MKPLEALLRAQRRRLVAHLARDLGLGHLALAEDAVQVASLRALQAWSDGGPPDNPAGWLYRVARHHAIDQLRRDARSETWPDDEADGPELVSPAPAGRLAGELDDEELALLFAACHPRLPAPTQVALALRSLAGLPLATIADGLFCTEAALAQRLARALAAHPSSADAEADAAAATLLLHGARLTGRLDAHGDIVPLPGQPRDRWDQGLVRLGLAHLQRAQRGARLTRWHLLAGVAAEHAVAPSYEATDWAGIVGYYEALLRLDGSAAPRLGHAVALAEAGEPGRALERLQALAADTPAALQAHRLAAMARAHGRLGQLEQAHGALEQAMACARHPADARMLGRQGQNRPTSVAVLRHSRPREWT